jgi:hypothetical protein
MAKVRPPTIILEEITGKFTNWVLAAGRSVRQLLPRAQILLVTYGLS